MSACESDLSESSHPLSHSSLIRPVSPEIPNEPIQPIPTSWALDSRKVALGEKLFSDPRLSHSNTVACASCHNLEAGGTDQAFRSIGIGGALGDINTPTVYNSGLNVRQFWDGRAHTLEDQIEGPIQHSKEMGSTWQEIIHKLKTDPMYVEIFEALYHDGISRDTIKHAIATFERSLLTPNSRFDRYLQGNHSVLTEQEKQGYALFKEYGCSACHQGANVGGNMFQKFGVTGDYYKEQRYGQKDKNSKEPSITHDSHRHQNRLYKVPSLRMAVLTPPYFHDGSASTLEQAVRVMAQYQLGRSLNQEQIDAIVAFLYTLPGTYKGKQL
ncbi:MAG: cytochrome-c peroxidase [Nitrospirales bacterium]|nr:cytochrome-c peroxidase [Nitrospira sp.]MDR4502458.1 cytochrome-c peroxidase [Nitrospirales bacterium]